MGGLVVGGLLAGAGKGAAEVGQMMGAAEMRESIIRMQQKFAEGQQAKEFGHQESMLGRTEQFQREQTEREIIARGGIARAEMAQKETLAGRHETAETAREHERSEALKEGRRITAAGMVARGQKPVPLLSHAGDARSSPTVDKNGNLIPGESTPYYIHNATGEIWQPAGDRLVAAGTDPKSVGRADSRATQELLRNPLGTTPDGGSLLDDYIAKYHQIPSGYYGAAEQFRQQSQPSKGTPPPGIKLPPGAQWVDDEEGGGTTPSRQMSPDEFADMGTGEGTIGGADSRGSPQPSDNEPAQ